MSSTASASSAGALTQPPSDLGSAPAAPGAVLALGFGTTVAMWAAAYFARLPAVEAPSGARLPAFAPPGWLLLGVFLLCLVGGGALAGRWIPARSAAASLALGARVGALASLLNLLILGSVLADHGRDAWGWIPGTIGIGAALGGLGALLAHGARAAEPGAAPPNWTSMLGRVAVGGTFLLLGVGGLVTSHDAGLAVPDWPNTYATNMFMYPLSRMTGGVYYEHAHRLFGSLVGLTTLALAAQVWRTDERRWIRRLAAGAFVLVCLQGLLGGLRVTGRLTLSTAPEELAPNLELALVHGVTGQVFFALLVGLAAFLSTTWRTTSAPIEADAEARETAATTRAFASGLVALVLVQLVLGALLRHFHGSASLHITGGVGVLVLGMATGLRAWGLHPDVPVFPRVGVALVVLVSLQFLLGLGAFATTALAEGEGALSAYQAGVTTMHQTGGAAVLGCAVLLRIWAERLPPEQPDPAPALG